MDDDIINHDGIDLQNNAQSEQGQSPPGYSAHTFFQPIPLSRVLKSPTEPHAHAVEMDYIVSKFGDGHIKATYFTSKGSKIDRLLRLCPDAPFMCTTNGDLKQGHGNQTKCRFVMVTLKRGAELTWKNCDGRKVNTASTNNIETRI